MAGTVYGKWYWSDWMSDPGVRASSYAARGLWIDMLCIAAQADPTGYVVLNGRPLNAPEIARLTGGHASEVEILLDELERNGVFTRDRHGRIYSRRMLREQKKTKVAVINGKLGGNPTLGNKRRNSASDNQQDNPPDKGRDKTHKPEARNQEPASAGRAREVRDQITQLFVELAPSRLPPDTNRAVVWLAQGYEPELILSVIREVLARKPDVGSLSYFDRRLEEARSGQHAGRSPSGGAAKQDPERPTPLPDPVAIRRHQLGMATDFYRGRWHPNWPTTLKPDHPDCVTPEDVLEEARTIIDAERAMSPAERAERLGIAVASR
jgi:hypothetical protein